MNYVILLGLALFFIAMSVRDGTRFGWRDGQMNVRIVNDDYALRISGDGEVDLAPDGSGVTALSSNGTFDVRLRRAETERRVLYTSADGSVREQYFVDGDEQPWGPQAEQFVAEVMPIAMRETALNADERVAWLLQNRGQAALLDEIDSIQSDFSQRVYTVRYADTAEIADSDFQRLMRITADHMSSDFDVRTTLQSVYDSQQPIGESFTELMKAGETMSSDFDARTLLEHVVRSMPSTPEAATAYLDLAATLSSDFDMRLALTPLVTQASVPDEVVARAMELGGNELSSDFDLRVLLAESAPRVGQSDALARAYTRSAASISSDFDQREVLTALANGADLTAVGWTSLLEAVPSISSDFDAATLLATVARDMPRDDAVMEAYRRALDTINSDFDRQRAAAALESSRPREQ
jgi:hypothetical protein